MYVEECTAVLCIQILSGWGGDVVGLYALWFSTYMRLHKEYMNNVCGGAKGTPLYILHIKEVRGKARPSCLSEAKHVR